MSDNSAEILTALYVQGESQRKAQDAAYENKRNREEQQQVNADILDSSNRTSLLNEELTDEISILQRQKQHLLTEFAKERAYRNELVDLHDNLLDKNEALELENKQYKNLLCKPMAEIAEADGNFKKTYETQMELIANWMVSQKAFKELAIQFGAEKGLSAEEVIEMGNNKKMDVLDNKHDPAHGSNANGVPLISSRVGKLKESLKK